MHDGTPLDIDEMDDRRVVVSGLKNGEIAFYLEDVLQFEVVRENCPLFEPTSLGLNWGGRIREIYEGDQILSERESHEDEALPSFHVENDALLSLVRLNRAAVNSALEVDLAISDANKSFELSAGPFGRMGRRAIEKEEKSRVTSPALIEIAKLLLSLCTPHGPLRFLRNELQSAPIGKHLMDRLARASWPVELLGNVEQFRKASKRSGEKQC
jgi:hypothetical protein